MKRLKDYDELLEGIEEVEEFNRETEREFDIELVDVRAGLYGVQFNEENSMLDHIYKKPFE